MAVFLPEGGGPVSSELVRYYARWAVEARQVLLPAVELRVGAHGARVAAPPRRPPSPGRCLESQMAQT